METLKNLLWNQRIPTALDTKYRVIADGNVKIGVEHLIRGVQLDTKYRVIADGNTALHTMMPVRPQLDTKYRVIADGNDTHESVRCGMYMALDTKYRVIADGNLAGTPVNVTVHVRYQVPRYSGWKPVCLLQLHSQRDSWLDTKYRVIADGNEDAFSYARFIS